MHAPPAAKWRRRLAVPHHESPDQLPTGQEITPILRQIANCLAFLVAYGTDLKEKNNNDRIPILARLGFDRNFIAHLLQTTPGTVSVRLSQEKAASKGGGRSNAKPRTGAGAQGASNP
jgi:hypothetical protein